MQPDVEQKEKILDWLEKLDRIGPFADLPLLRLSIADSPPGAELTAEYNYVVGLIVGRNANSEPPEIKTGYHQSMTTWRESRERDAILADEDNMLLGIADGLDIAAGLI